MKPRTTVAEFCILLFSTGQLLSAEEFDLPKIADIVQAYQDSIETLQLRTRTTWLNDSARKADPSLFGTGDVLEEAFAEMAGMRYLESRTTRGDKRVPPRLLYQLREGSYSITTGDETKPGMAQISSRENFRRPGILYGMYSRDGQPLYVLLRRSNCTLLGRKKVDGVSCYEIETSQPPFKVMWYLDPQHDMLCRKKSYVKPDGSQDSNWTVLQFSRVSDRWFPYKDSSEAYDKIGGSTVVQRKLGEVLEVHINEAINQDIFKPTIPEGALVQDVRGSHPNNYIQGGKDTVADWIRAELEKRSKQTGGQNLDTIKVKPPIHWIAWVTGIIALAAISLLVCAGMIHWRRG